MSVVWLMGTSAFNLYMSERLMGMLLPSSGDRDLELSWESPGTDKIISLVSHNDCSLHPITQTASFK